MPAIVVAGNFFAGMARSTVSAQPVGRRIRFADLPE